MKKAFTTLFAMMTFIASFQSASAQNVGLLIGYDSKNEITDDDEIAATQWFDENYPDGVIVTPATLDKIAGVSTLWVPIDRAGLSVGWKNLPEAYRSSSVIKAIADHVKAGGSLYLTTHATQLVAAIGRVSDTYAPNIFGSGEGGLNNYIWGINANLGCNPDLADKYDHRSHPIYQNLESNSTIYPDHDFFPLIGNGWKEDHNCKWDFNGISGLEANPNKLFDFEQKTHSSVIGAWQHVTDYACAGVVEFKPEGEYQGTILANGVAAYEFNENDAPNLYQYNVNLLTKNSIDYLTSISKKVVSAIREVSEVSDESGAGACYSISGVKVSKPTSSGIYIVNHKKVIVK